MTPELGQFHFQPKSSHFDTGGYFRLVVKRAFIFPILFPVITRTLEQYFVDRQRTEFPVLYEEIEFRRRR